MSFMNKGHDEGNTSAAKGSLKERMAASAAVIGTQLGVSGPLADVLVVLGSGFKGYERELAEVRDLDLASVPHMPIPRVEGHGASLVIGKRAGRTIAVLTGRVHLYEGYSVSETVFPLRVLASMGVRRVLLTNAAGSVDQALRPGQVVVVRDQLNLTGVSCLSGQEGAVLGPRFLDMSAAFDPRWRSAMVATAGLKEGVYAGVNGPAYETPAETRMLGQCGANVVGMSTVQEVLAARQLGLTVGCLSFVTNMAGGLGSGLEHAEVLDLVERHRSELYRLLTLAVELAP